MKYILEFEEVSSLNENKAQLKQMLRAGRIDNETYHNILDIDPTPQKKYSGWIGKIYMSENSDINIIRNYVEEYHTFAERRRLNRDIYTYKTFKDLQKDVDEQNDRGSASLKELENDYEIEQDDDQLYIVIPHTHEASRKLCISKFQIIKNGNSDSPWCTGFKNSSHFIDYYLKHKITFFYVLIKSEDLLYRVEQAIPNKKGFLDKTAVVVMPNGHVEIYDADDKTLTNKEVDLFRAIIGH